MSTTGHAAEDFRLLVSRVKDYAIFMLDPEGNVLSWNEGAERLKGYRADEIIGRPMSTFYPPDAVKAGHPRSLLDEAVAQGRVEEEGWRVRKDGSTFWADVVITALRDDAGHLRGFAKVTRDLSERREAELALSELSGRLLTLKDEEQRRIARQLHDSTSPLLTSMISKLYAVRQRLQGQEPGLQSLVGESLTSAETIATVIRSVTSLLHPPLLDESGLVASLRWYTSGFAGRNDVRVELDLPAKIERLPHDTEITLFRIVQETLENVARKTGARQARVRVRVEPGLMELEIVTQGEEIPSGLLAEMRRGRGDVGVDVAGMRERMRQLGGKLEVSGVGGGLVVTATLVTGNAPGRRG